MRPHPVPRILPRRERGRPRRESTAEPKRLRITGGSRGDFDFPLRKTGSQTMLQGEATLLDERRESMRTFSLEPATARTLADFFRGNVRKGESGVCADIRSGGPA